MANKWHVEWLNEGITRWNIRRKKVAFTPDLSGLNFFEALPPDFRDAPKTSMYFEKIDLSNADLSGADLSGSNFAKANFTNANLTNAKLSLSNFSSAKFTNANLSYADASSSQFNNASFENSILTDANFEGANASEAIFISSPIEKTQIASMERNDIKVYASRSEYREAHRKPQEQPQHLHFAQPYAAKDTRTHKNKYDVFFGTNRQPVVEQGAIMDFGISRDKQLNYGICEVIVPDGHQMGSLGSPLWKRLKNKHDDRLSLKTLISLNEELFFEHIKNTAAEMAKKERPTIFVHGFNTSFENAVLRAAQIGFDLKIGQGIGLFSWPSKGSSNPLSYSADEASSEASKSFLADFIEKFVKHSVDGSINIIAHSMGCRCLMGALELLAADRISTLARINQVILAAADIDAGMMQNLGRHAVENCTRTTSYVSDKDKALQLSRWLHDYPRVGITPPTFVLDGMDTVLVNDKDLGLLSHGYISRSRTVLADVYALLKNNAPPLDRIAVDPVSLGQDHFWRIRD